ncbi:MAG: hypothetical protein LBT44_02915 [Clostridiales bacterium]|jgi:hypothetical protein|nr:hypothetical protein [Clostridiales bacterium]
MQRIKNSLLKGVTIAMVVAIAVMSVSSIATASYYPSNGRAYGIARNSGTGLDGNFFRLQIKAMDSKWSSSSSANARFILHTTWLAFAGTAWIECGTMHGAIQEPGASAPSFWNGSYTAQGSSSTYNEYKISGPSAAVNIYHTYQISRTAGPDSAGQYSWGVYVDYDLRRTFKNTDHYGRLPDVGLESNESTATSAQWNEHSLQRIVNWSWNNWARSNNSLVYTNGASVSYVNSTTGSSIYTSK